MKLLTGSFRTENIMVVTMKRLGRKCYSGGPKMLQRRVLNAFNDTKNATAETPSSMFIHLAFGIIFNGINSCLGNLFG